MCGQRRDRTRRNYRRKTGLFSSLCEIFSIFSNFMFFSRPTHFSSLSLFCRQIKIISFLVSLNRRGKKHNREEGEKEEDKEEDKEEERYR